MKHMHRALVLLLTAALIVTACVPATLVGLAAETQDATTAPTEATQATQIAATESSETTLPSEAAIPTDTTDATEETTVPTAADQLSTEEQFTVSFDLNGGTVCTRGAGDLTVSAATGQEITMPAAPEKGKRVFAGWLSSLNGKTLDAGDSYTVTANDTFTAQWNMPKVLDVEVALPNDSSLSDAQCEASAISEAEQTCVETAVKTALRKDAVEVQSVLAMDISFRTESREEVQPENGETVPVTLSVLDDYAEYVKDAAFLVVYHMAEQADGSLVAEPVQCVQYTDAQQKISFGATGFSIYAVAAVGEKDGTFVTDKNAGGNVFYEMEEESSRVFFFQDSHSANYTYHRYTWTVEDNNNTVRAYSTSIYQQDNTSTSDKLKSYQYPWLSVNALRPGTVTVTVTHYCYNGNSWWSQTDTGESGTVTFTLPTIRKHGAYLTKEKLWEVATSPEALMKLCSDLLAEREANISLRKENAQLEGKAAFYDLFIDLKHSTNLRTTAKELDVPERRFVRFLIERRFVYRTASGNVLPYANVKNAGLFCVKDYCNHGHTGSYTLVTPQGKLYFAQLREMILLVL